MSRTRQSRSDSPVNNGLFPAIHTRQRAEDAGMDLSHLPATGSLMPNPIGASLTDEGLLLTFRLPDGTELNLWAQPQAHGAFVCDPQGEVTVDLSKREATSMLMSLRLDRGFQPLIDVRAALPT